MKTQSQTNKNKVKTEILDQTGNNDNEIAPTYETELLSDDNISMLFQYQSTEKTFHYSSPVNLEDLYNRVSMGYNQPVDAWEELEEAESKPVIKAT